MDPALQSMLDEHIPYRLAAIDGLRWVCELLLAGVDPRAVEVTFDSEVAIRSSTYRFMTNPMLEMGAVYCRVLLEFLGIGLTKDELAAGRRRQGDDIGIEHFGLQQLNLDDVTDAPFGTPNEIRQSCATTIHIAHKAVAHLTVGRQPNSDLQRLHVTSRLVPWLVSKHLYEALGLPEPRYRIGVRAN